MFPGNSLETGNAGFDSTSEKEDQEHILGVQCLVALYPKNSPRSIKLYLGQKYVSIIRKLQSQPESFQAKISSFSFSPVDSDGCR